MFCHNLFACKFSNCVIFADGNPIYFCVSWALGGMRKMRKAFVTIHHQFDLSISVESSEVRGLKFRTNEW